MHDTALNKTLTVATQYSTTSTNVFHLGVRSGNFGSFGYFNGIIDQVRIFSSALSDLQVTQLYNEHYQTQFTDGSDTAIVFTEGTGTVTFNGVDPASPQGALRTNTSYSEDGSASVIEHYNGTEWKYFDAIKYCTTNTLNFPSGAGCIASYNLNNNVDDIGNTYNGLNSNVTFTAFGEFGAAAVFNGSNAYVDLPLSTSSLFDGKNTLAVSFWFKTTTTGRQRMFTDYAQTSRNCDITIDAGSIEVVTDYNQSTNLVYASSAIYNDGSWHNLIVSLNQSSSQRTIYINGLLVNTGTLSSNSWSGSGQKVTLGAFYSSSSGYSQYFNGEIDQVRIYDDALTSDQAGKLYNNEIACS